MNLAASIQVVTEEIVINLSKTLAYETNKKNICLAYVKGDIKDLDDLFVEIEGNRYALKFEKKPLHDPSSQLMRN